MLRADVISRRILFAKFVWRFFMSPVQKDRTSKLRGCSARQQKRPGQARPSVVPHAAASTSVVNGTWLGDRMPSMYAMVEFNQIGNQTGACRDPLSTAGKMLWQGFSGVSMPTRCGKAEIGLLQGDFRARSHFLKGSDDGLSNLHHALPRRPVLTTKRVFEPHVYHRLIPETFVAKREVGGKALAHGNLFG